ncbi:MAG TPA: sigma factor-like helix-turn-helix DNA-binding protein [Solirubrobacteraceae bacterium]
MTQSEISACIGVSQMHVSRLLRHALDQLQILVRGAPVDSDAGTASLSGPPRIRDRRTRDGCTQRRRVAHRRRYAADRRAVECTRRSGDAARLTQGHWTIESPNVWA